MNFWRKMSILQGLENAGDNPCVCKQVTENYHEVELSGRPHRYADVRKVQQNFFNALMAEDTEIEKDWITLLKLPSIDVLRKDSIHGTEEDNTPLFKFTKEMRKGLSALFKKWRVEVLGSKLEKESKQEVEPESAIYPFNMLTGFAVGVKNTNQYMRRTFTDAQIRMLEALGQVQIDLKNRYLNAVIQEGGKRITAELGTKHLSEIYEFLRTGVEEGKSTLEVGRWMHKEIGEGKAWYWRRLARSETTLSLDAAFDASHELYQWPYEFWSAASNACPICAQFADRRWRAGEGPHPVSDTHPNCACVRRPEYVTDKPIQRPWTRPSPYEERYTVSDITAINEELARREQVLGVVGTF